MTDRLDLRFLGTGAADQPWDRLGEDGVRGTTATLVDGHVLIDCGTTTRRDLDRFGIDPAAVTDLAVTHSHSDHFDPAAVAALVRDRGDATPLAIHAAPQALARLADSAPGLVHVPRAVAVGDSFAVGALAFTVLPANHLVADPDEPCFHFLIEGGGARVLYALDGGWLPARAQAMLDGQRLDAVIWDATMADPGNYRVFSHNDVAMVEAMVASFRTLGLADDRTVHVLDHIAYTLWPAEPGAVAALAAERGFVAAEDGMALSLPRSRPSA